MHWRWQLVHLGQERLSSQGVEHLVLDLCFGNVTIPRPAGHRSIDVTGYLSVILRLQEVLGSDFYLDTFCPLLEVLWFSKFFPCRELGYGRPLLLLLLPLHLLLLVICLGPFSGHGPPCRCFGTVELFRGQDVILTRNPQPGEPGYLSLSGILLETCPVPPVEWTTVWSALISHSFDGMYCA